MSDEKKEDERGPQVEWDEETQSVFAWCDVSDPESVRRMDEGLKGFDFPFVWNDSVN